MTQFAPNAPQILVSNIVQLVNEGPENFRMRYGSIFFELGAGKSMFVNEDVAWHFLGRWWTDNSNPRQKDRQVEYQRLRTLYGAYEDEALWLESRAFWLKAYAPDGQQIVTVVDDPDGDATSAGQTPFGREMSLESQIEIMRQQMQQLMAENEAAKRRAVDEGQEVAPTDTQPRPAAPYNPSAPAPPVPTVGGVSVPTAPPTVGIPPAGNVANEDPDLGELGTFGAPLPVRASVAYDPSEESVPEDAPPAVKHTAQGGRIG